MDAYDIFSGIGSNNKYLLERKKPTKNHVEEICRGVFKVTMVEKYGWVEFIVLFYPRSKDYLNYEFLHGFDNYNCNLARNMSEFVKTFEEFIKNTYEVEIKPLSSMFSDL